MPSPQILTDPDDLNQVRAYLGLDPIDFTDAAAGGLVFLQAAELVMRKLVNKVSVDTGGAVPTVAQIMAEPPQAPATTDDTLALRIATAIYIGFQFTPSSTNAVDISVSKKVGPIETSRDRGGIGVQWVDQRNIALEQAGMYLSLITGWPEQTQTIFQLAGPTSSGASSDTVSGFWLSGRR
jgi:hypothetical protein